MDSPNDVFLKLWAGIVQEVLENSPEEYWESEQHEDASHKPGREGGVGVLPDQLPDEERETHEENKNIYHTHSHF